MIDITESVSSFVGDEQIKEGLVVVYVPHTTAGVTINEGADPAVAQDVIGQFSELAPAGKNYLHAEGNSDGHIKAGLTGSSVVIPVSSGKLALGTWQAVFFCEFDGPRHRRTVIKFIKT